MKRTNLKHSDIFLEDVEGHQEATEDVAEVAPSRSLVDELLEIATQRRTVLVRAVLLAVAVSTLAAFLIPKRYESTTRIMPPEGPNPAALLAAVTGKIPAGLGELAGGFLGVKNTGPLWMALLQSRTILDHQIDKADLMKAYWTKRRYRARKKLVDRTDLKEDRKSGVISITVSDPDPARAKALADGYVDELNQLLANVSTSSARRERLFIEQRLATAKKDLDAAELEFGRFAAKNSTLDLKEQSKAIVGAGAQLEGQIIAAQAELEGLQQTYTNENIRVRSVQARISSLRRELAKIGGTGQETEVNLKPGELSPPVRQLPLLGIEWADLYRKSKIQETVFELLTQQYEIAKIEEAKEVPTIKVIDAADYPEKRAWPPRLLIIGLGGVVALIGVLGWFKAKADWDNLPNDHRMKTRASKVLDLFRAHSKPEPNTN
jgi:uncharacterized protein involved in exopolysaccharide biosynthesis